MKKILILMLAIFLCSCSTNKLTSSGNTALDGVSITADVVKEKSKNGNTIYHVHNEYQNDSDRDISEIRYELVFLDKNGDELFVFSNSWNAYNEPLKNGDSITDEISFQKEYNADKLNARVVEVSDTSKKEAVHLPESGEYLYQAVNNGLINNIGSEMPEKVEIIIDHMGAQDITTIEADQMEDFIRSFMKVRIAGESSYFVTDNYNGIQFYFKGGSKVYLPFILYSYEIMVEGKEFLYELLDAEEMWAYALGEN